MNSLSHLHLAVARLTARVVTLDAKLSAVIIQNGGAAFVQELDKQLKTHLENIEKTYADETSPIPHPTHEH